MAQEEATLEVRTYLGERKKRYAHSPKRLLPLPTRDHYMLIITIISITEVIYIVMIIMHYYILHHSCYISMKTVM